MFCNNINGKQWNNKKKEMSQLATKVTRYKAKVRKKSYLNIIRQKVRNTWMHSHIHTHYLLIYEEQEHQ